MSNLTASIQESLEAKREAEWKRLGMPDDDIELSRLTGMDASDVGVFRHSEKIFASAAAGAKRGPMLSEARSVIVELNKHLVSRIQHGCQDDFLSPDNPGMKPLDHFVGFDAAAAEYLKAPPDCAQYYARRDMK